MGHVVLPFCRLHTLLACAFLGLVLTGCGGSDGGDSEPVSGAELDLPATHPRLWFTDAGKLESARAWYVKNAPALNDGLSGEGNTAASEALDFCFDYLMTGNRDHARIAIDWLMTFELPNLEGAISNDHARWYGEQAMLIYDWCHDEMTAEEIADRVEYFNYALETLLEKPWGHDPMPANNYFHGYLRNGIEWLIASADENPQADELWEAVVRHRLEDVLLPYLLYGGGRGGTSGEGGQYGVYMLDYGLVPFASLRAFDVDDALDIYQRTPFHAENLYYTLHSLTPGPTGGNLVGEDRYQFFPFGDDEKFRSTSLPEAYTNVALVFAHLWPETPLGRYARHFLDITGSEPRAYLRALDDDRHTGEFWSDLPLDYFAAGSGHFFARNAWEDVSADDDAALTVMHYQGGQVEGVGHYHHDAMNLQLWRGDEDGGYFLTRETTAYGDCLLGYDSQTGNGRDTLFHNGVSFEGQGQLSWRSPGGAVVRHDTGDKYDQADDPDGLPVIERLISDKRFAYIGGDYTRAYRAADGENPPRYDLMPYVETVRRDVVFLRDLEAVVVFDRLDVSDWIDPESGEHVKDASDIRKTLSWHFGVNPARDGNVFSTVYGSGGESQRFAVHTLTPAQFAVVDERQYNSTSVCDLQEPNVGQYRLEVQPDSDAEGRSFVVTVLHGADDDAAAAKFSATILDESNVELVVELTHADRGRAFLHLPKNASGEGSFAWSDDPAATEADATFSAALANRREYMYVGDNGPAWTTTGTGTVASDGKTLVGGYSGAGLLVLEQRVAEVNFDSTAYSVPTHVTRHRLLRLKPGSYAVDVAVNAGRFDVTLTRGAGELVVGEDFALEFLLDENGAVTPLHPPVNE